MANNDKLVIAYCYDNLKDANYLSGYLRSKGIQAIDVVLDQDLVKTPLHTLKDYRCPIYLLISDNFLRSHSCMKDGKNLLSEFYIPQELQPIITRGSYVIDGDQMQYVDTKFERVGDVISYMNFWQEIYLQLKEKQGQAGLATSALDQHKKIANEIGDFLGILRTSSYLDFETESKNGFTSILERFKVLPDSIVADQFDEALDKKALDQLEEARKLLELEDAEKNGNLVDKVVAYHEKTGVKNGSEVYEDDMEILDRMAEDIAKQEQEKRLKPYADLFEEDKRIQEIISKHEQILDSNETPYEMIDVETGVTDIENQDTPSTDFEDVFQQPTESSEFEKDKLNQIAKLIKDDNIDEALEELKSLIVSNPNNLDLQFQYASILAYDKKDHYGATSMLEQILEQNNEYIDAYFLLAQIAENHQDHLLAKSYYEKVINLDKKYPGVHLKIGTILKDHFPKQSKLALKYFKKAIKRKPKSAEAYHQYGLVLSDHFQDFEKAIKYQKKCLKYNPLHPYASFELAKLYTQLEKNTKAKNSFKSAVKINKDIDTIQNRKSVGLKTKSKSVDIFDRISEEQESVGASNQLDDTILITGATSGIGKAAAILFAKKGYRLILTGRRKDKLEEIKTQLKEDFNARIKTLRFDVRDLDAVKKSIDQLDDQWQNVDILINNAGLAKGLAPIHEGDINHWETMIDTNIKGLLYMTRLVSPGMVKRKSGHIINVCSTAGKEVYPKGNVYCATKHAVDALTKAMRVDLHKYNVKVSQVAPAHVEETEFSLVRFDGDEDKSKIYKDFNPLKSSDIAEAIMFIIDRPAHVNIQDIVLMGTQQANSNFINRSGRIFD